MTPNVPLGPRDLASLWLQAVVCLGSGLWHAWVPGDKLTLGTWEGPSALSGQTKVLGSPAKISLLLRVSPSPLHIQPWPHLSPGPCVHSWPGGDGTSWDMQPAWSAAPASCPQIVLSPEHPPGDFAVTL